MSNVYFISDLHLGHDNILKVRTEFKTIEEHDEYITSKVLEVSDKRSVLYILGDACLDKKSLHLLQSICGGFKAAHLVLGNHDLERNEAPSIQDLVEIPNLKLSGLKKYKEFWLSHCPLHPDHLRGKYNIHGHLHSDNVDDNRYVNVSSERVEYTPFSLEEIRKYVHAIWD